MHQFATTNQCPTRPSAASEKHLSSVLRAVHNAERRAKGPVYFIDVYKVWMVLNESEETPRGNDALWEVKRALIELFKSDQVLCDTEMNRFSVDCANQNTRKHKSEFDLCSDRLVVKFPTYQFDKICRIVPGPTSKTFSFDQLKEHLLSKDLSKDANFNPDDLRFLDGTVDMTGNRVAFQSFVRSGNTFLRRFIEQITGVYTGSDMSIDYTFFEAMMGLVGQGHTNDDNQVWLTKTHFPLQMTGTEHAFAAEKMICVVRNPLDIIASYAFFVSMKSHSLVPEEKLNERFPAWWKEWVTTMAEQISYNHDYIVDTLSEKIPSYIFRYEDLILDPEPVLLECFRFLFDVHTLEGTVLEARIKSIAKQGFAAKSVYTLKNTSKIFNKNASMYSAE